ncbi:hypothetical protein HDU97_008384, partial [Phlyctochytrium planicorne]
NDMIASIPLATNIFHVHPHFYKPAAAVAPLSRRAGPYPPEDIHSITGVNQARAELGVTGKGIKIAILDNGIDYMHPALGGGFGQGFKIAGGTDLVGDAFTGMDGSVPIPDSDPIDTCSILSHGTHVAGVVGADARNIQTAGFVPSAPFTGVAPEATLMAYRIIGCSGTTSSDVLTAAIYRAAGDGADIINVAVTNGPTFAEGAQKVTAAGHFVVGAIGNSADAGLFTGGSPGLSRGALAVAAFENLAVSDKPVPTDSTVSTYSSPGLDQELFIKPDIGGLGQIYSTVSRFTAHNWALESAYISFSGTSMACAYVSGAIALILQGSTPKPTFDQLRTKLQNSALLTNKYQTGKLHSVAYQGAGLINVYNALKSKIEVTPSALSLNDTLNAKAQSITVKNTDSVQVTFSVEHQAALLVTPFKAGDQALLSGAAITFSDAPATVTFTSKKVAAYSVTIKAGATASIPLYFTAPAAAVASLYPIYSGYIVVKRNGATVASVLYAGMAGKWRESPGFVKTSATYNDVLKNSLAASMANAGFPVDAVKPVVMTTGVYHPSNFWTATVATGAKYRLADTPLLVLPILATNTRLLRVEAVFKGTNWTSLNALGITNTSALHVKGQYLPITNNGAPFTVMNPTVATRANPPRSSHIEMEDMHGPNMYLWVGDVVVNLGGADERVVTVPPGKWQIRFAALKNYGNVQAASVTTTDFDVVSSNVFETLP